MASLYKHSLWAATSPLPPRNRRSWCHVTRSHRGHRGAPFQRQQTALADLLKQDAELHAKIAKAANGITEAVVWESVWAALGADASKDTA